MNVGCPDTRKEEQKDVREVVHGNKKQADDVGARLEDAVKRVEGNGGPGCQRLGRFVLVVERMDIIVKKLVGVQGSMHPIDADFNKGDVRDEKARVVTPAPNLLDIKVRLGPTALDKEFGNNRQHSVNKQ